MLVWLLWRQENQTNLFGFGICLCSVNSSSQSSSLSRNFPKAKERKTRKSLIFFFFLSHPDPEFVRFFLSDNVGTSALSVLKLTLSAKATPSHVLLLLGRRFLPTWLQNPGMSSSVLCVVGFSIALRSGVGFFYFLPCTAFANSLLFCAVLQLMVLICYLKTFGTPFSSSV